MNPGLYLVSTPIGNLDDITLRAINILKNSNLILCENTTNSKKLLKRYDIKTSLSKYTDHDFNKKKDYIYKLLKSNQVEAEITGREKTPFSIWRKMQNKKVTVTFSFYN